MQGEKSLNSNIYDDPYMREAIVIIKDKANERRKSKKIKPDKPSEVLLKRRSLSDFLPDGNEDITILTLFTLLPYITGIIFAFIVIAGGSITRLISLGKYHSFPLLWAIGYEILAFVILVWILKIFVFSFFPEPEPQIKRKPIRRRR
jgi:hypothetical protein